MDNVNTINGIYGERHLPEPLFHDVIFTIIDTPDLQEHDRLELVETLCHEAAEYIPLNALTNQIDDLAQITHIISTTSDFPQYAEALHKYVHVVKPSWVKQCLYKGKQTNPRQFSPDRGLIFSDVVVSCADIPEGDKEAIAGGCLAMGGLYSEHLTKMVTHLMALSVEDERCQYAVQKNLRCKILLPHWFDDCLRLGKRVSETPYLLPNPEILRKQDRPPTSRANPDISGATVPHPVDHPPTPSPSFDGSRHLEVFDNKSIMLSSDLRLGLNLEKTIKDLIVSGGGRIVYDVEDTDVYICRYRSGEDYIQASLQGIDVGNLAWLYHLIMHNRWTSPFRRLLHYPTPPDGIPGFENLTISVSNYSGDARLYLENLIKACGAKFTKTMHQDNTHLITAHMKSEKCEAAADWGINVVNHLWIEESYARFQMQSLTIKRYNHFPERINLGEVIGQQELDRVILEKNFFPRPKKQALLLDNDTSRNADEMIIEDPQPPSSRAGKRKSSVVGLVTPTLRKVVDTGKENETPSSRGAKDRALSKLHESAADIALYERERKRVGGITHGRAREESTDTPAPRKSIEAIQSPRTSESRGAKEKALSKLHDSATDIALYEREKKRVGGVTHGVERRNLSSNESPEITAPKDPRGRKRQSTEIDDEVEDDSDTPDTNTKKSKRSKADKTTVVSYRMVLTGYQRWVDNPKAESSERNTLRNLGIHITEETSRVQLLCAPKIVRTKKFVCALASAPHVVSTAFLDYCIKNKKVPDPSKYPLDDRETEDRLGLRLYDTLQAAKVANNKLLQTWQIFCTDQILGGFDTFRSIIEANGGSCLRYQGRTAMAVTKRKSSDSTAESQTDGEDEVLVLLSGTSKQEQALWPKFRQMAEKAHMDPRILKSDWLLSVAMRCEIHFDTKWELHEGET